MQHRFKKNQTVWGIHCGLPGDSVDVATHEYKIKREAGNTPDGYIYEVVRQDTRTKTESEIMFETELYATPREATNELLVKLCIQRRKAQSLLDRIDWFINNITLGINPE